MHIDKESIAGMAQLAAWLATEDDIQGRCAFLNACLDLLDQLSNAEQEMREELDKLLPEL